MQPDGRTVPTPRRRTTSRHWWATYRVRSPDRDTPQRRHAWVLAPDEDEARQAVLDHLARVTGGELVELDLLDCTTMRVGVFQAWAPW